jgi:hypothetical protein
MVLLIAGGTHLGKTNLAQKTMEKYRYPYLSIDHLKMGLIRAGYTSLTPEDRDEALCAYLWPVVREIIKTCIENDQNLIVEGCYIPFDWKKDFPEEYAGQIRFLCLIFSQRYIRTYYDEIRRWASVVENRGEDEGLTMETLLEDTRRNLAGCEENGCAYYLIEENYCVDADIWERYGGVPKP